MLLLEKTVDDIRKQLPPEVNQRINKIINDITDVTEPTESLVILH